MISKIQISNGNQNRCNQPSFGMIKLKPNQSNLINILIPEGKGFATGMFSGGGKLSTAIDSAKAFLSKVSYEELNAFVQKESKGGQFIMSPVEDKALFNTLPVKDYNKLGQEHLKLQAQVESINEESFFNADFENAKATLEKIKAKEEKTEEQRHLMGAEFCKKVKELIQNFDEIPDEKHQKITNEIDNFIKDVFKTKN